MKISEQLTELLKQRGKKVEALEELRKRTESENRSFSTEEQAAFDEIDKSIEELDKHAERLNRMEDIVARSSTPAGGGRVVRADCPAPVLEKGMQFARYVQALMAAKGNVPHALELSRAFHSDTPNVQRVLEGQLRGVFLERAAVAAATVADVAWAGALTASQNISGELISLVRPRTIIGQLNARRVPFNTKIAREVTAMATAQWVGEGKPKPVGKATYDLLSIPFTKLALITVQSEELARFSNPDSTRLLRDGLVNAILTKQNQDFANGGLAPVVGTSPGGIANGLPPAQSFASSGSTPAQINADLTHAVVLMTTNNALARPAWVMSSANKAYLSGLMNVQGNLAFPSVGGGTLMGYPVIDSGYIANTEIWLVDQEQILLAEDPSITVDMSDQASLKMDDAPAVGAAPDLNLWQANMIGLRAEQFIWWGRARDTAIVQITGVAYTVWGGTALAGESPPPTRKVA